MNKKLVMALVLVIITVMCAISFTACNDSIVYDAGEYGEVNEYVRVQPHTGYKFIGWDKSGRQGIKKLYKAQYEHIEYYLTEEKDIYICPQEEQTIFSINYKITDMQTMQVKETGLVRSIDYSTTDDRMGLGFGVGEVCVNDYVKEFDGILTLTVENAEYNIKQEFNLHVVRNRIKAESLEIYVMSGFGNVVRRGFDSYIKVNTLPENTSFTEVTFHILGMFRNGEQLSEEDVNRMVYFNDNNCIYATEETQVGDVIRVQAVNKRDPEAKSNILDITVFEY